MTDDKITHLHSVPSVGNMSMNAGEYLQRIIDHVRENDLIDLDDDLTEGLDLTKPEPNETRLGELTKFEASMFALAMHSQTIIHDIMIEAQALFAEQTAKMLRQQKIHGQQMVEQEATLTAEDRVYVNQLSALNSVTRSNYEFSVRARYNEYTRYLVVRDGMQVYAING